MIYLAHIYFRIEIASEEQSSYDLQWRIIHAENVEEAMFEARKIALNEESSFINTKGQLVNWRLSGITDLREVDLRNQGELIGTSTVEKNESEALEHFISLKNRDLVVQISKKELIFSR